MKPLETAKTQRWDQPVAQQHTSASKGVGAKVSDTSQAGGANKTGSDLEGAGSITGNKPEGIG